MALARRVEEELLILQPEQLTIPLPKTKENIIILPRKHEIAVPCLICLYYVMYVL